MHCWVGFTGEEGKELSQSMVEGGGVGWGGRGSCNLGYKTYN